MEETDPSPSGEPAAAEGTGDLVKGSGLARPGDRFVPREVYGLVKANQNYYPISTMCRLSGVSSIGCHA